jgi:AcrR family transcriptional regulator
MTDPVEPLKRRGRPRAYDPEQALSDATDAFWQGGYAGTSLDALSAATGMNRPSLYGAFGDKHALYLLTLDRYIEAGRAAMAEALDPGLPLAKGLRRVFDRALATYLSPEHGQRGCFLIGTAATEAAVDEAIRSKLGEALRLFDRAFETRLRRAQEAGELPPGAEPAVLAKLASAVLHSLALRARAGDSAASLRALADAGVRWLCGQRGGAGDPQSRKR